MPHPTPRASTRFIHLLGFGMAALIGLLALALGTPSSARAAGVIYVRSSAAGAGDGTSWANAYPALQSAIAAATSGDQIWVAAGTYTPGSLRSASFTLKNGVTIYGGFAGTETLLSQRNIAANITTLSGDIGTLGVTSDNSYHVVTGATGATLDGFTISGGNADGSSTAVYGGGIYNSSSSPTLNNLIIKGNSASNSGGGIYNSGSSPTLTNVVISGNKATSFGAGIANWDSSNTTLTNVTISSNLSTITGGGAGIDNYTSSTVKIRNSIIWGNRLNATISSIFTSGGSMNVSYSLVEGSYTGTGNLSGDPRFANAVGAASAPTTSGDYHVQATSPAIDAGNNGVTSPTLPATDYDGNARQIDIANIADTGNGSAPIVDMGAYEAYFVDVSSISRFDPATSTTTATSATFQVIFPESLSGVDASDFTPTLVSGITMGASVTAVSGSGTTWQVTANFGGGAGVMRLDSSSAARVTTSAGVSAGLRPFTSGETYSFDTPPLAPVISSITTDSGIQTSSIVSDPTISLNGTAEANTTITLTRADVGVIGTTTADGSGNWSFDYTGTALALGSYSFTAIATDATGNGSPASSVFAVTVRAASVIYVRAAATGANDGTSWADAYTNLQVALNNALSGDQIWVAAGTYTPGSLRSASFTLKNSVAIYGGFAGTETLLGQRSWTTNVTTLSGDIGTLGATSDNSYHVVTGATGATLDGFTISGGTANGGTTNDSGGGIYNLSANPTLRNLIISGNQAADGGAGILNNSSIPTLTNVTISGNQAIYGGGMYNHNASNAVLTSVIISGNSASSNGGGIFNQANSNPTLTNVIISGNTANQGGGIYNNVGSPTLTNVTIAGNRATSGGGIYNNGGSSPIQNSIIWGNRAGANVSSIFINSGTPVVSYSLVEGGHSGTGNLSSDPQFVSAVAAASAPTTSGDYRLQLTSPALDAGDNSVVSASTDLAGQPRLVDLPSVADTGNGTAPIVDMGAYEQPTVAISSITRLSPSASITNASSVQFQVVFAKNVSAVDTSDFAATVVSGSLSGISITSVSGSGTTYSVTVDTGSDSGVLRLEPAPAAQVVDAASQAAGVDSFSSGETYTIDRAAPDAPTITSISTDTFIPNDQITNDSTLIFYGQAEASSTVTLTRDDLGLSLTETADSNGEWMIDATGWDLGASDHLYSFFATATDALGTTSAASPMFYVTIDVTAPATPAFTGITTDNGAQADGLTNDPTISLNGTAEPGATITLTRLDTSKNWSFQADANGNWNYDYTAVTLPDGSYEFSAQATDLAGNTNGQVSTFTVTIDTTPPAAPAFTGITTDAGTQLSGKTSDPTISLNGTAEAGATITLTRADVGVIGTATADSLGAWSFDYTGTELAAGSYTFAATAGDALGNTSPASSDFVVTVRGGGSIIYVRHNAAGAADGTSWADAYNSPAQALAMALNGDQIWVAAGSYPLAAPLSGIRTASFKLKSGVAMYGGFAGAETLLSQRDWDANATILSGDVNGDGATSPDNSDNSYHVVVGATGATLDGFTIAGGNADGGGTKDTGGGIYNANASPTLAHLRINDNAAEWGGGGMYNDHSNPTLTDVTFSGNTSSDSGGGMYNGHSNPTLTNVSFSSNQAQVSGGGLLNNSTSSPTLSNVSFNGNSAGEGGGMYSWNSSPTLTTATFNNNSAQSGLGGGLVNNGGSSSTLTNVTFTNNSATSYGGAIHNAGSTLTITGGTISNNTAASNAGGIHNVSKSTLSLVGVTISGNQSSGGSGGGLYNINSSATLANTTISGNTAKNNGGGIYNHSNATLSLAGSTLSGNSGSYGGGIENDGKLTLANSTLSANTASTGGGGINIGSGTFTVTGSLVRDNIATNGSNYGSGGGFQMGASVGTITNTTFSGNQANGPQDDGGGAIMAYGGTLTLNNVTIAGNSTTSTGGTGNGGGGIGVAGSATITLKNTIVAGNSSSAGKPDLSGTLVSGSHNLIGDATGGTGIAQGTNSDLAGTSATSLDAKLAALAGNGGPTQTRALLSGSPAIDAGDPATCAATDQRGYIRINPCDIGAYEVGATMAINQAPTLDQPADLTILEDASAQTVTLAGIGAGAGESQVIMLTVASSNPALIPTPAVSYASPGTGGSLTFTPVADATGTATITITARDSGGTNGGGVDTIVRTFTVQVTAVNDAPDFTAGANQVAQANAGAITVSSWASGFSPGPADEASQTAQSYTVISNSAPELFTVAPAVDASGTLAYTPKPGARGTATIGVVVRDSGGTTNGGADTSTVHTFTITIGASYQVYIALMRGA